MAIQLYCQSCKSYVPTASKKCPKCSATFPREGRKYRVDVTVKGKRITRFCDNLTIAREVEGTIRADLVRGEYDITVHKVKKEVTLADLWKKYLPWAKEHKKSWKDDELYYGRHVEPRFGKKALGAITPLDIERMKIEMKKSVNKNGKPYAAATIKHQVVIIRRLYNLARKWGIYAGPNPVDSVQMPKLDNEKTEFLSNDELQRLIDTIESWPNKTTACLFKFAILTGFRQGEIRKLTWDAIDFEHSLVTLRDPKGTKTEIVPISPEALDVLRELEVVSGLVFPSQDGNMKGKSTVIDAWKSIKKKAGLPADFRFHGLRHNFASWLVSNGVDLAVVQKLMTHKNATTTQRYAHLMPGAVKNAAVSSGKILNPQKRSKVIELKQD